MQIESCTLNLQDGPKCCPRVLGIADCARIKLALLLFLRYPNENPGGGKYERHARYWTEQAFSVLPVIRNSEGEARWMRIDHISSANVARARNRPDKSSSPANDST